jgi:hypothetical protein
LLSGFSPDYVGKRYRDAVKTKERQGWGCGSVAESLPNMHEALGASLHCEKTESPVYIHMYVGGKNKYLWIKGLNPILSSQIESCKT